MRLPSLFLGEGVVKEEVKMARVKISEIKVGDRVREDFGDVEGLAMSIMRLGLLHPIIVTRDFHLVAGERRLKACQQLGWDEIEVKFIDEVDDLTRKEIELEENIKRKDFTWQEEVKAKQRLDELKRKKYGSAIKGYGGGWGLQDTAESLQESVATVSMDVRLAKALEEYPELAKEKSKSAAWKKYLRLREQRLYKQVGEIVKVKADVKALKCGDAKKLIRELKAESVDLVITDPPYGIDIHKSHQLRDFWGDDIFGDLEFDTMEMLRDVLRECYRILKPDRHLYLFFGIQFRETLVKMLEEMGFTPHPIPLVWVKPGIGMGQGDYTYANTYETILFAMKGKRKLAKSLPNIFQFPRVPPNQKIHPTEKPISLLKVLIEQSTIPGEVVLDPFAGSGSALVAAFELRRKAIGFEKDTATWSKAVERLKKLEV